MTQGCECKYMVKQKENIIWPYCDEPITASDQIHMCSLEILLEVMYTGYQIACAQFCFFTSFSKCWEKNEGSVLPMQKLYFLLFLWVEEREFEVLIDRPFAHL